MKISVFLPVLIALLIGCKTAEWRVLEHPGEDEVLGVTVGDRFYFDLEENMTTGYSWDYVCDNDDVEVTIEHKGAERPKEGAPMLCGAPGRAAVRIRILGGFDGPASVRFLYRRPWEKAGKPARSFTLGLFRPAGAQGIWK